MKENRRSFVKMAAAGAAGMVVGGGKALAQDGLAPMNTPITKLLGSYSSYLVKDAKKLTKGDLIQLRKFHTKDPEVTKLNSRLKKLDFNEIKSIETAFDKFHHDQNFGSVMPSGDVNVSCCCCSPCCTCAAAVIEK